MIVDANSIPFNSILQTDICIVGGGAAGITLALSLMDSGLDVTLLESGGLSPEPLTQKLHEGVVADERLHTAPDRYRIRSFGGSTTLWGGRCMPFDEIDFEPRDYIAHSGWPIGMQDVLPYYPRANALCEAGDFAYTAASAFTRPGHGMRPMIEGFDGASYSTDTLERFSCPTDFGARYRRRLEQGPVRVLLHANLTSIDQRDSALAGPAHVRTLLGNVFAVRARAYVIAAGGLETARLLLASPGLSGRGLGNAHDVVGRYYMCHIAGTLGVMDLSRASAVWHGYEVSDEGIYCRRRFALRAVAQKALRAGNFVARLHHPRIPDAGHGNGILSMLYLARPFIPYEYGKRLYGDDTDASRLAHFWNVLRDAPGTALFLLRWLRTRNLAARKFPSIIVHPRNHRYSLDFHAEQEPNPDSRVTLDDSVDALGMRRLRVDWRYTAQDVATVRLALAELASEVQASGVGSFAYEPDEVEAEMTRYGAYGGHHIGLTRMGTDARTSVVDAHCRVHEAANLYVAGPSVFTTSSQANPTLTLVALALRLADRLRQEYAVDAPATAIEERV